MANKRVDIAGWVGDRNDVNRIGVLTGGDITADQYLGHGSSFTKGELALGGSVKHLPVIGNFHAALSRQMGEAIPAMPYATVAVSADALSTGNFRLETPGAEALAAMARGEGETGIARVRNYFSGSGRESYIRVGGNSYIKGLRSILRNKAGGAGVTPDKQRQHILAGWYLGYRAPLAASGVRVNGDQIELPPNVSGEDLLRLNQYVVKSPQQVIKGAYGKTKQVINHPDWYGFPSATAAHDYLAGLNRDNLGRIPQGALAGRQRVSREAQRGATVYPLRRSNGEAVPQGYKPHRDKHGRVNDENAGCNVYGSGPGLTDNADGPNWRFYPVERKSGAFCAKTPNEYIAPNKQSLNKHSASGSFAQDVNTLVNAGLMGAGEADQQNINYKARVAAIKNNPNAQWFGTGRVSGKARKEDLAQGQEQNQYLYGEGLGM